MRAQKKQQDSRLCPILVFLALCLSTSFGQRLDTGSPCAMDNDCENRNVLLSCTAGLCACPDSSQNDIVLDPETGLCSAAVGTSCYRQRRGTETVYDYGNQARHYVPCIRNATCVRPARLCECDRHHFPSANNRTCPLQKGYGQSCMKDSQCDGFRYLQCLEGQCGCGPGLEYHAGLDTCYRRIGSNCTRENMYDNIEFPGRYDSCPPNAECYNVCTCRPQFRQASDGTCMRDYGAQCDTSRPCSDLQFSCQNRKCACKYPRHQIFEPVRAQCLSLVPGPCNVTTGSDLLQCVDRAKCVETGVKGQGQCRCLERYQQSREGLCLKPHGYDCELDTECSRLNVPLACINNVCSCPDLLYEYERETSRCMGKVGSRCSLGKEADGFIECGPNLNCTAFGPDEQFGLTGECETILDIEVNGESEVKPQHEGGTEKSAETEVPVMESRNSSAETEADDELSLRDW